MEKSNIVGQRFSHISILLYLLSLLSFFLHKGDTSAPALDWSTALFRRRQH